MKEKLIYITIFAIAMACLESAVVVYIRELYFPEGFSIMFRPIKMVVIKTELTRELATIIMLYTIACLTSVTKRRRFAWFLYSFAIWDIFYYAWLKVFINWPASIFEWDILFLLPVTWLGPVLAPVLCSMAMIVLALLLLKYNAKLNIKEWLLLMLGCGLILYTFMYDYGKLFIKNGFWKDITGLPGNKDFIAKATALHPIPFQWALFLIGFSALLIAMLNFVRRNRIVNSRNIGMAEPIQTRSQSQSDLLVSSWAD